MPAATQRFSNRVDNYVRYRPGYPVAVIDLLREECGLNADAIVADVGSGTGILTALLLDCGCRVFGVEPNPEMRETGERLLKSQSRFTSVVATAEQTILPDRSVNLITAGQAFHWFDQKQCREEFARILKPGGRVALTWNDRRTDATPFLAAYEALLKQFATDYEHVNHRNVHTSRLSKFFGAEPRSRKFSYEQQFDFEGLKGRLLSSSYVPEKGQPNYDAMLERLREIFDAHQRAGRVAFEYDTLVFHGQLS